MADMNNNKRYGRFTSSEIYKLIKIDAKGNFHAPAITYIEEKIIESRIESCLSSDAYSNPLAWGTFMELVVYSILGMEYQISSKETSLHPVHGEFWSGSKDLFTADPKTKKILSIAEIKCYQKKKFAQYSDCLRKKDISLFKSIFPQEYWQIVSNCCIDDCEIGEAIAYMPYVSEAEEIKNLAENYSGDDAWKYRFIYEKSIKDLPFIPDNGYYKNITKFAFIVPQEDKDLLEERVLKAYEKKKELMAIDN